MEKYQEGYLTGLVLYNNSPIHIIKDGIYSGLLINHAVFKHYLCMVKDKTEAFSTLVTE